MTQIPAPPHSVPPLRAYAAAIVANVSLAFGPWFVRLADVGPAAAAFWRMAIALPVLIAIMFASGWRPRDTGRGLWVGLAVGGLCFAADLASWHAGILRTTLANATLFGNSATLIFPIYGFIVARALPTRRQGGALALAVAGGTLLLGRSYQLDPRHLGGDLLCLLAGILYSGYFMLMARARETLAPVPALALSMLFGIAPLLVFALMLGESVWPHAWGPLIGLALGSQLIGQGLMIYAIGKLSPLAVGIALLIQPVVGALIGRLAYGEHLGAAELGGAAMVAAALVLVRQPRVVAPDAAGTR